MQIKVLAATKKNSFIASNSRRVNYKRAHNAVVMINGDVDKACTVERHIGIEEDILSDIVAFSDDRSAMVYVYKDIEVNQSALGMIIFSDSGMVFSSFNLNGLEPKALAVASGGKRIVIGFNENADNVRFLSIEDANSDAKFAEQKVGPYYEALTFNGDNYFLAIQTKDDGKNPMGLDVYSFDTLDVGSLLPIAEQAIKEHFGEDASSVRLTPHICAASTESSFFVRTTSGVLALTLVKKDGAPRVAVSHILPMAINPNAICLGIICSQEGNYVGQINKYPATDECDLTHEVFVRSRNNRLCWTNTLQCDGVDVVIDTSDRDKSGKLVTELV